MKCLQTSTECSFNLEVSCLGTHLMKLLDMKFGKNYIVCQAMTRVKLCSHLTDCYLQVFLYNLFNFRDSVRHVQCEDDQSNLQHGNLTHTLHASCCFGDHFFKIYICKLCISFTNSSACLYELYILLLIWYFVIFVSVIIPLIII